MQIGGTRPPLRLLGQDVLDELGVGREVLSALLELASFERFGQRLHLGLQNLLGDGGASEPSVKVIPSSDGEADASFRLLKVASLHVVVDDAGSPEEAGEITLLNDLAARSESAEDAQSGQGVGEELFPTRGALQLVELPAFNLLFSFALFGQRGNRGSGGFLVSHGLSPVCRFWGSARNRPGML